MSVEFIAEVASNHNGDFDRCIDFIDIAKEIGCQGVKFQLFKINKLFAPEILQKSPKHRSREMWELPFDFIPRLAQRACKFDLKFICTVFDLEGVDFLNSYVDAYKISSYELLWLNLLERCAKTKKPLILSTGMAELDEVDCAIKTIRETGIENLTLLHCVSKYPAFPEDCNLAFIDILRKRYGYNVGWSDHTVSEKVIYRAVYKWNVSMVEFHMDLDSKGREFNMGHCWLPDKIGNLIHNIKRGVGVNNAYVHADGDGIRKFSPQELEEKFWRADPSDGLRPFIKERLVFKNK